MPESGQAGDGGAVGSHDSGSARPKTKKKKKKKKKKKSGQENKQQQDEQQQQQQQQQHGAAALGGTATFEVDVAPLDDQNADRVADRSKTSIVATSSTASSAAPPLPQADDSRDPEREGCSCAACWHRLRECIVVTLLIGFNVLAFFCCAVMVAGQVAAMSTLDLRSPELMVLGLTIGA
jgi:hypothetical protein